MVSSSGINGGTILGDTFMNGMVTYFDIATSQIGFAPSVNAGCSLGCASFISDSSCIANNYCGWDVCGSTREGVEGTAGGPANESLSSCTSGFFFEHSY